MKEHDETEVDETDQYRYLFTVRQPFNRAPIVDCFHELSVPAGLTSEQAQIMTRLNEKFCKDEIARDTDALRGMELRLRFNADMYQHVCLVLTTCEIASSDLEKIIQSKAERGTLTEWLEESALKTK